MVTDTLQSWCDSVVQTGAIHAEGGDVEAAAEQLLRDPIDYDSGKVLFKPTLASGSQTFRPSKEGALAYFIGSNSNFPNDNGFLLKPWVKVWFDDLNYILHYDIAMVQCNVHFIGADQSQIFVNKSFVFKRCDDGNVRIVLH